MADLNARVRAICDMNVGEAREYSGRHEYDGVPQDLSPAAISAGLARVTAARASAGPVPDAHDEAHLRAFEDLQQVVFGDLGLHRSNPLYLLGELDLACYDKDYAPAAERQEARARHLAAWPRTIDAALESLDQVSAPVARSLLSGIRGLAAGIPADADPAARTAALAAHARFVAHIERAAQTGPADTALGAAGLTTLLGTAEAIEVDLGDLARRADAERDRLSARLAESAAKIDGGRPPLDVARELVRDHPDRAGVISTAKYWTQRALDFTLERDLMPVNDGVCLVGEAPESRRWAMAMISTNAPAEPDAPSWYWITPPEESWPAEEIEEWLEVFSATTLPAITVHEVAPGHFSHHQAVRRAAGDVRRTLFSPAFVEGWAHYAEELCVEEGFLADDPRFAVGVWLEALVRVTRLASAIGVHTLGWTVEDAARRFETDTHLQGQAALSEARRATFDPTYGRYTWGKLEILRARESARAVWGAGYSLKRFHTALMDLAAPPLGLISTAIGQG
ncbi:MAG TPA: DUF885 family protein [Trebonia sp.]|jgi:hypothetical protein|nr:DUF885 family protein [Trebonia sp.]